MTFRKPFLLTFAIAALFLTAAAPTHKLEPVEALPEGLSAEVSAVLNPQGVSLEGPDGKLLKLWLVKELAVKPDFKPSLNVKYPFASGQLIGVLEVEKKTRYQDFRGQRVRSGVYTLRYGEQPSDGNHLGTSELSDYLVAIPADADAKPETIGVKKDLLEHSAKTTRGTHPAVFSLMSVEKPVEKATLEHNEEREWWIVNVTATGKNGSAEVKIPIRLVLVGKTEAE
jgi:hypothetical protein